MNVLGVYPSGIHDSNAALVVGGKIVAAAEEERFTRKKHESAAPFSAINYCLQESGLSPEDIDAIAVPWLPFQRFSFRDISRLFFQRDFRAGALYLLNKANYLYTKAASQRSRANELKLSRLSEGTVGYLLTVFDKLPETFFFEHHKAHAASAFYCSGFKKAGVATIDGSGELNSSVVWNGNGRGIAKISEEGYQNSLGTFYSCATAYVSLGKYSEGKLMGLAAYGKENKAFESRFEKRIFSPNDGKWYKTRFKTLDYSEFPFREETLGFPKRTKESALHENYAMLAYYSQKFLEQSFQNIARYAVEKSGTKNLCLAGGVALNCSANSSILENNLADGLFIFPAANDGGSALGAALLCAAEHGEKVSTKLENAYFGPGFSNEQIGRTLKELRIKFEERSDIAGTAAELLSRGKVVGWFQGRMELGPRALGNRSILADPRGKKTNSLVNSIKGREPWRPLAPSILEKSAGEYLENSRTSPFMLLAFQVKKERRKEVPAIVHVDGSTRPQTVNRKQNKLYYKLISEFESISSVPLLLNTSFNLNFEPIVCTPIDAVRTFFSSKLDALAIGNCLVTKK